MHRPPSWNVSWSALSDPARALAEFLQKKSSKFAQKKSGPKKQIFVFVSKKKQVPGVWLMPPGIQSPRPTIPEFSKTESDPTSTASARVRRLVVLANVCW
jgi:hypothetical protein